MTPDLDELYAVLRQWAVAGKPQTYGGLSRAYHARTGDWFEPHGSWDGPLGELNNRLATVVAPALSALVILKGENEPGANFKERSNARATVNRKAAEHAVGALC